MAEEQRLPAKAINLNGQQFGRWTVISFAGPRHRQAAWLCRCQCGEEKVVTGMSLRNGGSQSCGCLQRELTSARNTTHGRSETREFFSWLAMQQRCNNANDPAYHHYGGRGISICDRWQGPDGFANFLRDMGGRPAGLTLGRIDNDGNYTPENCRWETPTQQVRNRRTTERIEMDGESLTLAEWAERYGHTYKRVWKRVKQWGWDLRTALTTPADYKSPVGPAVAAHTKHAVTHDGRTQTLAAWARELGIPYRSLYKSVVENNRPLSEVAARHVAVEAAPKRTRVITLD